MISKKINGKVYYYYYYYLTVSARVDGKPRIVEQKYLGTAEDIAAAMAGATAVPDRSKHLAFGDLAAAWWVVDKLGVVEIVDAVVGGRRSDAGASVGLLAVPSGFGDQVGVVSAWRVDEGVMVSLAA